MFDIANKFIIVTGSNRGNGLEIAKKLIFHGAKVIRIDQEFNTTLDSDDYLIDLSKIEKLDEAINLIIKKYPIIHALVNNAGVSLGSDMPYEDIELYKETLNINLNSNFVLTSRICSLMKNEKIAGSIVNITSLGSDLAFSKNPSYQISKAGLKQMTKAFAMDWGIYDIRVNSISPGYINTKMTEKSYTNNDSNNQRKNRTMLGRWGKSEDLVGAVIFLISDASSYITASEIKVDGGWSSFGV